MINSNTKPVLLSAIPDNPYTRSSYRCSRKARCIMLVLITVSCIVFFPYSILLTSNLSGSGPYDSVLAKYRDQDYIQSISKLTIQWPTTVTRKYYVLRESTDKSKSEKRTLVLVFGILRTGSTTLIHHVNGRDHDKLESDGYTSLLHHCNGDTITVDGKDVVINDLNIWKDIRGKWDTHGLLLRECLKKVPSDFDAIHILGRLNANENGISSSQSHWKQLQKYAYSVGWNIQVVVPYRRYFEWAPSYMSYIHEQQFDIDQWSSGSYLPFDGFAGFEQYINRRGSVYTGDWGSDASDRHPTETVLEKLSNHFDNVVIFNLHALPNNIIASFYCGVLNAQRSCALTKNQVTVRTLKRSRNVNYHIIAEVLHNEWLISETLSPNRVAQMIADKRHELNLGPNDNLPLKCMDQPSLNKLLDKSLKFEARILPKWFRDSKVREGHFDKFFEAVRLKKYCVVDGNEIAGDEKWHTLLTSALN